MGTIVNLVIGTIAGLYSLLLGYGVLPWLNPNDVAYDRRRRHLRVCGFALLGFAAVGWAAEVALALHWSHWAP